MELVIRLSSPASAGQINQLLQDSDPAAVVALDPASGNLRVATCASPGEVHSILTGAGLELAADAIEIVPSVCCGGCSG